MCFIMFSNSLREGLEVDGDVGVISRVGTEGSGTVSGAGGRIRCGRGDWSGTYEVKLKVESK
jgi:hypothetical protein